MGVRLPYGSLIKAAGSTVLKFRLGGLGLSVEERRVFGQATCWVLHFGKNSCQGLQFHKGSFIFQNGHRQSKMKHLPP